MEDEKMKYWEWSDMLQRKHDYMPSWWWNQRLRQEAYEAYLEDKSYG
jgi:hypothetical protein